MTNFRLGCRLEVGGPFLEAEGPVHWTWSSYTSDNSNAGGGGSIV